MKAFLEILFIMYKRTVIFWLPVKRILETTILIHRGSAHKLGELALKWGELVLKWSELVLKWGELVLKWDELVLKLGELVLKWGELVLKWSELVLKWGELAQKLGRLIIYSGFMYKNQNISQLLTLVILKRDAIIINH